MIWLKIVVFNQCLEIKKSSVFILTNACNSTIPAPQEMKVRSQTCNVNMI